MIIVEDGTGVLNANSYASDAAFVAHHIARGNVIPGDLEKREQALILATDYIEQNWRTAVPRLQPDQQGLQWPVKAPVALPNAVVKATLILAYFALEGPLEAPKSRGVKSVKKSLEGVGSTETVFDDAATGDPYPMVSAILSDIAESRHSRIWFAKAIR